MEVERVVIPSAGELRLLEAENALRKYAVAAQAEDERIEQLERACCAFYMLVEQANGEGVSTDDVNNAWALMESLGLDGRYLAPWGPREVE